MILCLVLSLGLAGCGHIEGEAKYPSVNRDDLSNPKDIRSGQASIFGKGGLGLFGKKDDNNDSGASGIGVNSFLWRAALDTVAFMPLASADPFGGVILTDWYSAPETPGDRFKLNVFILDKHLRSDAIQVKVFKQSRRGSVWRDVAVPVGMGAKIEDAILTRARQLRVAQMGSQ